MNKILKYQSIPFGPYVMKTKIPEYMNTLIPMVVEQSSKGERAYDIYSRLL